MTNWTLKPFSELTPFELYAILQLRSEVFVVEQNCVYQDMDNKDLKAVHFMGWKKEEDGEKLIAHTRLLAPGISYPQPSIGRVVSSPSVRGLGIGRELMERSIAHIYTLYGRQEIRIGAQLYLKKFYSSLGFIPDGEVYLEDDIEHITMYKP
ncbi:MAG: GNAT family N-acetyltransferase [Chitinophagales bacterium]|jgi:ElaA protein|nr:GNAT family N-acetyltransferase [Chitinophagales bacterium]